MNPRDAKRVADRYIGRDGKPPTPIREAPTPIRKAPTPTAGSGRVVQPATTTKTEALALVASFIAYHDPAHIMGGVRASEAMDALDVLMDLPRGTLRKAIMGGG